MRAVYIKNISGETKTLNGKEFTSNEEYQISEANRASWIKDAVYTAIISDEFQVGSGTAYFESFSDQINWLMGEATLVQPKPFADKTGYNFAGKGVQQAVAANTTTNINFTVPASDYGFDFDGLALIGTENNDKATMKVLDDSSGTYSGTPNALLNQFATDWNTVKDKCSEMMPYPARVYANMVLRVEYTETNNNAKTIGMNVRLHKVLA